MPNTCKPPEDHRSRQAYAWANQHRCCGPLHSACVMCQESVLESGCVHPFHAVQDLDQYAPEPEVHK